VLTGAVDALLGSGVYGKVKGLPYRGWEHQGFHIEKGRIWAGGKDKKVID